jgi:hypothetical protein
MQSTVRLDSSSEARRFLSPRVVLTLIVGMAPLTFVAAAIKGKR